MHTPSRSFSPQGMAYLSWLQDRGLYWYTAPSAAIKLVFLCDGKQLTAEHQQLLQRMGQAVGLSPSQFQSLCIGAESEDALITQIRNMQPICGLVLGKCPAFLSTLLASTDVHMESTWSLQELLELPQRKKDTWTALQTLREHWSTPTM